MRLLKVIGMHKNKRVIVDDDVYEAVKGFRISLSSGAYARVSFRNSSTGKWKEVLLHRVIAGAIDGEVVDHKSTNTLDNRRSNLRICTIAQNVANSRGRKVKSCSKYKGVSRNKSGTWLAVIGRRNDAGRFESKYLGTFGTEYEAHLAYAKAISQRFGEFARCGTREDSFIASEVTV